MSFGLPPLLPKPSVEDTFKVKEGPFGVPDIMTYGFAGARNKVENVHQLETSEKNYMQNQDRMEMAVLRNIQGLHAPLRLAMERKATQSVGRLPFLPSSGLSLEVLRGEEDRIQFTDILYPLDVSERLAHPHAVMEHKLGIL